MKVFYFISIILFILSPKEAAIEVVRQITEDDSKTEYYITGVEFENDEEKKSYIRLFSPEFYSLIDEDGAISISRYYWSISKGNLVIKPEYRDDINQRKKLKTIRDTYLKEINKEIESWGSNLSTIEKLDRINNYLYKNYSYDYVVYYNGSVSLDSNVSKSGFHKARSWSGIYEDKNGVCSGFANLFKKMANIAGVDNVITVSNGNHAWNAAYIDGEWKYFDSTWNNTLESEKAYFNLSYSELEKRNRELLQDPNSHKLDVLPSEVK